LAAYAVAGMAIGATTGWLVSLLARTSQIIQRQEKIQLWSIAFANILNDTPAPSLDHNPVSEE
jgi:hypothetical protein